MAGSGICELGGRDGAVRIDLYVDVDADSAANGGAGFFGDLRENFAKDGCACLIIG